MKFTAASLNQNSALRNSGQPSSEPTAVQLFQQTQHTDCQFGQVKLRVQQYPLRFRPQGAGLLQGPLHFLAREIRTVVYVDGFNLYYGCLKNSRWKWLDLVSPFEMVLLSHHQIATVKCFTARLSGTPGNPSTPQRQETYLRALQHFRPKVEI